MILVYRIGQLGDAIVTLPAVFEIKRRHPNDSMVLLTENHPSKNYISSWDILKHTRCFDDVLFYVACCSGIHAFWEYLRLVIRIRRKHAKELYYLVGSRCRQSRSRLIRDFFFFRVLCGVKKCTGFNYVLPPPKQNGVLPRVPAEWKHLLEIVTHGDDSRIDRKHMNKDSFGLPVPGFYRARAQKILSENGINEKTMLIAICPGSKREVTRWPCERYVALSQRLMWHLPNYRIVILGGLDDQMLGKS